MGDRVVAARMRAAAGSSEGAPPSGENNAAAANEEVGFHVGGTNCPGHERKPRLYEQAAPASPRTPGGLEGLPGRCGDYVRRWCRWVMSGLSCSRWAETRLHGRVAPDRPRTSLRSRQAPASKSNGGNRTRRWVTPASFSAFAKRSRPCLRCQCRAASRWRAPAHPGYIGTQ